MISFGGPTQDDGTCREQLRIIRESDAFVLGQDLVQQIHDAVNGPEGTANLDERIQEIQRSIIADRVQLIISERAQDHARNLIQARKDEVDDWAIIQAKGLAYTALRMFEENGAELYRQQASAGVRRSFAHNLLSAKQAALLNDILDNKPPNPAIDGRTRRSIHLRRVANLREKTKNNHILYLSDLLPGEELEIGLTHSMSGMRSPTKKERKTATYDQRIIALRMVNPTEGVVEIISDSYFIEGYSTTAFRGSQLCNLLSANPLTKEQGPWITRAERLHLEPHVGDTSLQQKVLVWWVSSKGEIIY